MFLLLQHFFVFELGVQHDCAIHDGAIRPAFSARNFANQVVIDLPEFHGYEMGHVPNVAQDLRWHNSGV